MQDFAVDNPMDSFERQARTLINAASDARRLERWDTARDADEAASNILRRLHALQPYDYFEQLARSLHDNALDLSKLGHSAASHKLDAEANKLRLTYHPREHDTSHLAKMLREKSTIDLYPVGEWNAGTSADADARWRRRSERLKLLREIDPLSEPDLHRSHRARTQAWLRRDECAKRLCELELERGDHRAEQAQLLSDMAFDLRELKQWEKAQAADFQAEEIYRELLGQEDGFTRQCALASSLHYRAVDLCGLQLWQEAQKAELEALNIRRGLFASDPSQYRRLFADSLHSLAQISFHLHTYAEARDAGRESLKHRREMYSAAEGGNSVAVDIAQSLQDLASAYHKLGNNTQAQDATDEAIELRQELYSQEPGVHSAPLASLFRDSGVYLRTASLWGDAYASEMEGIQLWRELYTREPDAYRIELASALSNIGITLRNMERWREAKEVDAESTTLWRKLYTQDRSSHRLGLAISLLQTSIDATHLGLWKTARDMSQESVKLFRAVHSQDPIADVDHMSEALVQLSASLRGLGHWTEAQRVEMEIIDFHRLSLKARPDDPQIRSALAISLGNKAHVFRKFEMWEEAADADSEVVRLRRELRNAKDSSSGFALAEAIDSLSLDLACNGRWDEALDLHREADRLGRDPKKPHPTYQNLLGKYLWSRLKAVQRPGSILVNGIRLESNPSCNSAKKGNVTSHSSDKKREGH